MNCQSCGMPMDKPEDHGGGDVNNPHCKYCTDPTGNLLPRDQIRSKMIQFYVQKQGKTQEEAGKLADQLMGTMPAWKGGGAVATPAEPPVTPEPAAETPQPPEPSPPGPTPVTQPPEPTAEPSTEPETPLSPKPAEEKPGGTTTE